MNLFISFILKLGHALPEEMPKKARKRTLIEQTPDDMGYSQSDQEDDEPENG